jgi:hypothetical protein
MAKRGYVYCLANDVTPNIVKIGATTTDPVYRLLDALAARVESRRSHPSKWHFRSEYGICAL